MTQSAIQDQLDAALLEIERLNRLIAFRAEQHDRNMVDEAAEQSRLKLLLREARRVASDGADTVNVVQE